MSDPFKIVGHVPAALQALADTDLSLVEKAAVFRLAAESCQQAQVVAEIVGIIAKGRRA